MEGGLESIAWWIIAALAGQSYRQRQRIKALEGAVAERDKVIGELRAALVVECSNSNALHEELRRALSGYEQ
jgi:hypothetical protein